MGNLAILLVAAVVGLVGYNYFTTGEIRLIPGQAQNAEARELADLEELKKRLASDVDRKKAEKLARTIGEYARQIQ